MGIARKLTAATVRNAAPGRHGDGDGLYLLVRPGEPPRGYWLFRYKRDGRMREVGLGRARGPNAVALAEAREKARALFRAVRDGRDPLADREAQEAAQAAGAAAEARAAITFREVADTYLAAKAAGWRNPKHRAQWTATLDTYAIPHMGALPVAKVGTADVLAALSPIWQAKPETASRVRGRIEAILSAATVQGLREGENPARWRGHLAELLPARSKVAVTKHHAALPWMEMPAFMLRLSAADGLGARALELAILTAARSGEVIGMRWPELDLAEAVWTVPAARMKAGRLHRVPLCDAALALLRRLETIREGDFVFAGATADKPLSNMALLMALRRMKRGDLTAHGFRSTFRDWAAERSGFAGDVAEAALAHVVSDKTEAAYRRGDLFEKRRELMAAWGDYCTRPAGAVVLPLRRTAPGGTGQ